MGGRLYKWPRPCQAGGRRDDTGSRARGRGVLPCLCRFRSGLPVRAAGPSPPAPPAPRARALLLRGLGPRAPSIPLQVKDGVWPGDGSLTRSPSPVPGDVSGATGLALGQRSPDRCTAGGDEGSYPTACTCRPGGRLITAGVRGGD